MSEHYAVVGPPGCGKTTYLKRQVERAAKQLGSDQLLVVSLTKAAAAEIKGRDLPIPESSVGTLHAMCYRALGCPKIAESKLDEWNTAHPTMQISSAHSVKSPESDSENEARADDGPGDGRYEEMNLLRHARTPLALWKPSVKHFHTEWQAWLADTGYLDFTGLIEQAVETIDEAPGRPLAMFVDEAQDFSALEVELVQRWGALCSTVVAVGDPAQCLYSWRGASANGFLEVGETSHRKTLGQSYRVPAKPHAMAVRWAGRLLDGIEYKPREHTGSVGECSDPIRYGDGMADLAERHLSDPDSGTLMIQALCSYMLRPALAALRARAIPFHNPNRLSRGDWNPLAPRKGTSTLDRIKAFLSDEPTIESFLLWAPMLQSKGIFARGAKDRLKDEPPKSIADVQALFVDDAVLGHAFSGDPAWLQSHVTADYAKRIEFPLAVVRKRGVAALDETPRVMLGTVHSFKGAEADHVVVSPDLSPAAYEEYVDGKPSVVRAFYVALTRTRDRLTLLAPSSRRCVDLAA